MSDYGRFFPGMVVMYGVGATPADELPKIEPFPTPYVPVPVDQLPPPGWVKIPDPKPGTSVAEAVNGVMKALEGLDDEQRKRVLRAAAVLCGIDDGRSSLGG